MKIDKEGNIKLNWFERKLTDERFGYALLFALGFSVIYFYLANTLFEILSIESVFFSEGLSLVFVPLLVGAAIGIGYSKLIGIEMDYKRRQRWLNRRK